MRIACYITKATKTHSEYVTIWRMRIACHMTKATKTHSEYVTIWRMRIACYITKATKTHSEYVTIWRMRIACYITKATKIHSEYVTIWRKGIACHITKATKYTQNIEHLFVFHCNNGWAKVPQCYVIRTLPAFFYFKRVLFRDYDISLHLTWLTQYSDMTNAIFWHTPGVDTVHTAVRQDAKCLHFP